MKIQTFLYIIFLTFLLANCQSKETFNPVPFALLGLNGSETTTYESEDNTDSTTTGSSSSSSSSSTAQGSLTTGSTSPDNLILAPPPPIAATSIASATTVIPGVPKMQVEVDSNPGIALTSGTEASYGAKALLESPLTCDSSHPHARQIKIKNLASASGVLMVESITLETSGSHFSLSTVNTGDVAVGSENNVYLCFEPSTTGYKAATITVKSNDRTAPVFRLIYTGSGAEEVTATVLKPSTGAGRFQNIIIEFSHAMDRGTVCPDANLDDNHNEGIGSPITIYETNNTNNKIYGRCSWGVHNGTNFTSYTQLIFDPYKPLDPNKSYSIAIPNGKTVASIGGVAVEKVCLTIGNCNTSGITTNFTTEYNYDATFKVNNLTLGSKGVVLNKASASTVTLKSTITNSGQADSIVLKKIGSTGSSALSNTMTLSDVTPGSNSYVVEIKKGAKIYYRSFSFVWGPTAANPETYVVDAATVAIGKGQYGVARLGNLLQRFIKSDGSGNGDNFKIPNGNGQELFEQYLTLPTVSYHSTSDPNGPDKFPSNGHPNKDRYGNNCVSSSWGGMQNFDWITNLGPVCDVGFVIKDIKISQVLSIDGFAAKFLPALPLGEIDGFADVFVTDVQIPQIAHAGSDNVTAELLPENDHIGAKLKAQRLRGSLRLKLGVPDGCVGKKIDIHIKDPIFGATIFKVKGCLGIILKAKKVVYDIDFVLGFKDGMTEDSKASDFGYKNQILYRDASSKNDLTVASNGDIQLKVRNFPTDCGPNNLTPCTQDPNLNIHQWSLNLLAYNARNVQIGEVDVGVGIPMLNVAGNLTNWFLDIILQALLDDLIPGVQYLIVQGIAKDLLEIVSPNVLNAVFKQLRFDGGNDGMNVPLPDYLPAPFNDTELKVGLKLKGQTHNATSSQGLGLNAHVGIQAQISGSPATPPALQTAGAAVNSFAKLDFDTSGNPFGPPPLGGSNGLYNRLSSAPGVLVALRADAVNQAMYQLWKAGGFNLTLNQSFANTIKNFRGDDDRLFQIFQILLKASALKKVLAPGAASVMYAKDQSKGDALIQIRDSDDMEFRVMPMQPPVLKALPLSQSKTLTGANSGKKFPLVEAEFGNLKIEVVGKRNGVEKYTMATLLVNFRSKAALDIGTFSSPVHGNHNDYQNVTSIKLNICDDNDYQGNTTAASDFDCDEKRSTYTDTDDLSYSVQVLEGTSNNPLGLDPNGIYEVLNPTVQKLIIPVLNHVLAELPLEQKSKTYLGADKENPNLPKNKIAASCGLRLNDMEILPIPAGENKPYFLINGKLSDYTFGGSCSL
ncbi:MAG: hypothetical protein AAF518_09340 [Spirochaetota bacterium]